MYVQFSRLEKENYNGCFFYLFLLFFGCVNFYFSEYYENMYTIFEVYKRRQLTQNDAHIYFNSIFKQTKQDTTRQYSTNTILNFFCVIFFIVFYVSFFLLFFFVF